MARKPRRYPTMSDLAVEDAPPVAQGDAVVPSDAPAATPVAEDDPMPSVAFPAPFERSLLLVLAHEGGFVDHPRDPGGATNLGISLRYAVGRGSLFDLDGDGDVDVHDIRLITPETAAPAYYADFWQTVRATELPAGLGHVTFDAAVNSGPGRAIRWLQAAVGATVDGAFGPKTLAAVRASVSLDGTPMVIERLCAYRLAYLRGLDWNTFGRGWQRRVERVIQEGQRISMGLRP